MKSYKNHIILLPIILALITLGYISYGYFHKISVANNLKKTINEQRLLKELLLSFSNERMITLRLWIQNKVKGDPDLAEVRKITDIKVKTLIDYDKENSSIQIQLQTLRNILDMGEATAENTYLNFYEHISRKLSENYIPFAYDADLGVSSKLYLLSLNSIYNQIKNLSEDGKYLLQAMYNLEVASPSSMQKWLNNDNLNEIIGVKFLPNLDIRNEVVQFIKSDNIQSLLAEFHHQREIVSKDVYKPTIKDLEDIDSLILEKIHFFTIISDIIGNGLWDANEKDLRSLHIRVALICSLMMFLIATFVIILGNLTSLKHARQKAIEVQRVLEFNTGPNEDVVVGTLEHIKRSYQGLYSNYEHVKIFNALKNNYLTQISKSNNKKLRENMESLVFLRNNVSDTEQVKAVGILEENIANSILNFNNVANIVDFEKQTIKLQDEAFSPQKLFKKAIEASMHDVRNKHINFTSYIDPSISNELYGDSDKIFSTISNLLLGAITQCSQYARLSIQISNMSKGKDRDMMSIGFSVKTNANFMSKEQIARLLDTKLSFENSQDQGGFWFAMCDLYLKMMGSTLEIKSSEEFGNEFSFVLRAKILENIPYHNLPKDDTRIAFIESSTPEYNKFLEYTLNGLGIKFEAFSSAKKLFGEHNYDIVLVRDGDETKVHLKNLVKIQDPLTPLNIIRVLHRNLNEQSAHKFILNRPQILVLESNSINLNLIKYAFSDYSVDIVAPNDYSIQNAIAKHGYDLILMDTNLPNINTIEQARHYKSNEITSKTPIIAMISNTSQTSVDQALEIFDDVIKKPFNRAELARILSRYVANIDAFSKDGKLHTKALNIMLYKKSSLENKIFAGALSDFSKHLTIVDNLEEMLINIAELMYSVIFIDDSVRDFDLAAITNAIDRSRLRFGIDTRLYIFSTNTELILSSSKHYASILSPQISKTHLVNIIKQDDDAWLERERERESSVAQIH